jgi:predicted Holliday junction resolvase-like endonuclease
MEITSFVLGMLTVIAVIIVTVVIKGIVKITKLESQLRDVRESMEWRDRNSSDHQRDIFDRINQLETEAYRHIEEQKRETISYIDSRIDKLHTKTNKEVLKG